MATLCVALQSTLLIFFRWGWRTRSLFFNVCTVKRRVLCRLFSAFNDISSTFFSPSRPRTFSVFFFTVFFLPVVPFLAYFSLAACVSAVRVYVIFCCPSFHIFLWVSISKRLCVWPFHGNNNSERVCAFCAFTSNVVTQNYFDTWMWMWLNLIGWWIICCEIHSLSFESRTLLPAQSVLSPLLVTITGLLNSNWTMLVCSMTDRDGIQPGLQ